MPPLNEGGYLVNYLFELGPAVATMGGQGPITDLDLQAWQRNQGIDLTPWECRTIRTLSKDYCDQAADSTHPHCIAPWLSQSQISAQQAEAAWDRMEAMANARPGYDVKSSGT